MKTFCAVDIRHIRSVSFGRKENFEDLDESFADLTIVSFVFDNTSRLPLNFAAINEDSATAWVDGINLLKKQILSLKPRLHLLLYPFLFSLKCSEYF